MFRRVTEDTVLGDTPLPEGAIVFLGDSITAGYGLADPAAEASNAAGDSHWAASATDNVAPGGITPAMVVFLLRSVNVFVPMEKESSRHCSGCSRKNSETGWCSQPISPSREPRSPFAPP